MPEEYQQQPVAGRDIISYGLPVSDNLAKTILDTKDQINQFKLSLQGIEQVRDTKTKKWKTIRVKKPVMNQAGINEIIDILNTYLDKNTFLSIYSEQTINKGVQYLGHDLVDLIADNFREWEMEPDFNRIMIIIRKILFIVHTSYNRALSYGREYGERKGMTFEGVTGMTERREIISKEKPRRFRVFSGKG